MVNKIQIRRSISSGQVPSAGQLVNVGELFVNTADDKLFVSRGDGTYFELTSFAGGELISAQEAIAYSVSL